MSIPSVHIEGFNRANGAVGTRETVYGPASSLWRVAPALETLQDPAGFHHFFNDFYGIDTTNNFTLVADTGGTAAVTDAAGGVLAITTDADDNDEAYVSSKAENWKFAASKPLYFEARVSGTADNLILGLSDTVGADTLLDTEAGPAASYDGAVFFLDAGASWKFETSNAGTQVTNTDVGDFAAGTYYRLGFIFDPNDGTTGKITPYYNGVAAGDPHDITLSGLEEMHILLGAKNKDTTAAALSVDYVRVIQVR